MAYRSDRRFLDLMCPAANLKSRKADEGKARRSPCRLVDEKIVAQEPNIRLQRVRRESASEFLATGRSPYTDT